MFDKIGKKIKITAMVIAGIIILIGAYFALSCFESNLYKAGVFAFIVSIIIAWLETCTLYGFGEIIEKVTEISDNVKKSTSQELLKDYLEKLNTQRTKTQNENMDNNQKVDIVKYEKVDETQMEDGQNFCPICKIRLNEGVELCPKCGLDIIKRKQLLS